MKAVFSILQSLLIMIVVLSMLSMAMPWSIKTIGESMDLTEVKTIKPQFDKCSEGIIETARTGSTNKCFFNINRGKLTGDIRGLDYKLISSANICDPHELIKIDEKRFIWQSCSISGGNRIFEMLWMFPKELNVTGVGVEGNKMKGESSLGSIDFDEKIEFKTLSLNINFQYQPGESGKIVEMSRVNITEQNVTIRVKFVG
jgi:hypothetical protein